MALLGLWGFDDSVNETSVVIAGSPTQGVTPGRSAGGYLNLTASGQSAYLSIAGGPTSVVAGFAARIVNLPTDATSGQLAIVSNGGIVHHLIVRVDTEGHLQLVQAATSTVVGTSVATVPVNVWFYVETKASIADAGGTAEVLLDGVSVITFTGDTRNNTGSTAVNGIYLARLAGTNTQFDDAYICDLTGAAPHNNYLGDLVVKSLLPSGNGDSSQFVGSDGNSTDNYLLVDETNSTMTDYVGSAVTARDLYQMQDVPATATVLGIQEIFMALKSDGGTPPTLTGVAKGQAGGVRVDSVVPALSTTGQLFTSNVYTTDPDGNALTAARVNAMQVGVNVP